MNPACRCELFRENGDIIEKAHIDPYCATADNSFENLVLLCPNCHTDFDKNHRFSSKEVLEWKRIRQEELKKFFGKKFSSFEELREEVAPLLMHNQMIYKYYYLNGDHKLWDAREAAILSNNRKIRTLIQSNLRLFQKHSIPEYSNLEVAQRFIAHIDEFEISRADAEKNRRILFPAEIDSIFGITPVDEGSLIPSVESLEALIAKLKQRKTFINFSITQKDAYVEYIENQEYMILHLTDLPRLRQVYNDYGCFRRTGVRLESLLFALRYMQLRAVSYTFTHDACLREIRAKNYKIIFVYEYCLSRAKIEEMMPEPDTVIVNLQDWNGDKCISTEARDVAKVFGVRLLTKRNFCGLINSISQSDGCN
ncbi:MAG: HNH endonuclease signature motif containing protein [Eubacterium sp.]